MSNPRRETDQHAYYRELFTKLFAVNPARAEEIQALPIVRIEKITLLEKELGCDE
jgi:hypothetical protein